MDYRDAGVDIETGRTFVNQIHHMVERTRRSEVIGGLGGFSGLFQLSQGYQEPVLVASTDGVGTKLKLAHSLEAHYTVGIDLVAMCVNDVLTSGAEPLFFLDYLATGQLRPEQLTQVIAGITEGCCLSGCALLGGETAEMPGFYQPGEYDLAGFCVGVVEKSKMLDGSQVKLGDIAIGLGSQGVHSNGFSLVRKIVAERGFEWSDIPWQRSRMSGLETYSDSGLSSQSLGAVLMTPTRIYVKPVLAASQAGLAIHGMAHITGGGLPENLPRCLGPAQSIRIDPSQWSIPPIFHWLAEVGEVSPLEMFKTFNMGIGFALLVPPSQVSSVLKWFTEQNIAAYQIGEVIPGEGELIGLPD